jgi:hypothetical protein
MPGGVSALLTREITARNTSANGALGRPNELWRQPNVGYGSRSRAVATLHSSMKTLDRAATERDGLWI